jgi:hypothetical protein
MLSTLRRKILGETRSIPLGVASAFLLALAVRALLPHGEWEVIGGFTLAAAAIATLICSLPTTKAAVPPPNARRAALNKHTTTRTHR